MTLSTPIALKQYRDALRQWLARNGLNGGGGPYVRSENRYQNLPEPTPAQFGIEGFALKIAAQLKENELKDHQRKHS